MKVKCERRSENLSRTPFEFWPFSFSSFLPSQNHNFTCSPFTQPVVGATTHNASSTSAFTAFTRHPSRFSSPVHGHGLDAIAMGFTVHAHLLQTKTILLLRTNEPSSELLQLCGFNWRVWCEGCQGDRARVCL